MDSVLEKLKQILLKVQVLLPQIFPRPAYDTHPAELEMNQEAPVVPTVAVPAIELSAALKYFWDTPEKAEHSVRVMCDDEGLSASSKDILQACIRQESRFDNSAIGRNTNKRGFVTSIDWGICQINDTPGWHIGPGLAFESVADVVNNPEKAVRYMIHMYKAGKINLWTSYSSGAYKQYLKFKH